MWHILTMWLSHFRVPFDTQYFSAFQNVYLKYIYIKQVSWTYIFNKFQRQINYSHGKWYTAPNHLTYYLLSQWLTLCSQYCTLMQNIIWRVPTLLPRIYSLYYLGRSSQCAVLWQKKKNCEIMKRRRLPKAIMAAIRASSWLLELWSESVAHLSRYIGPLDK